MPDEKTDDLTVLGSRFIDAWNEAVAADIAAKAEAGTTADTNTDNPRQHFGDDHYLPIIRQSRIL